METIRHSSLLEAIWSHATTSPDKAALVSTDGRHVSYRELADCITRSAGFLYLNGVRQGDRVLLSAQKEVEFVYSYFGAHMLGAVNVVVDAKNNEEHIGYIASVVKPILAIGLATEACPSIDYANLVLPVAPSFQKPVGITSESTADIMFTSGTTGKPKGVCLSHYNVFSSASNINGFIGNGEGDVELLALPVCHSFGLGRLRCNMLIGATVVLHNGFANIKSVFDTIERYGITGFGMVPAVWAYIKRFSGKRISRYSGQIHYIEIGSAAMPVEDKQMLAEMFPDTRICMHYGLTEASRAVFMEFHEYADDLASAGRNVSPAVEIKIVKEDGGDASPFEEGEVCIRGNMVMKSYFSPGDNDNAFINGFFRTGDWGYMAEDGRLYLVARKKELINVGGKKVSPVEIEDALAAAGVGESMCVAMKDPDGILGEVPKALLVRNTFAKSVEEIREALKYALEPFKMPRVFEIVDSIPKTSSGKKKRTQ